MKNAKKKNTKKLKKNFSTKNINQNIITQNFVNYKKKVKKFLLFRVNKYELIKIML